MHPCFLPALMYEANVAGVVLCRIVRHVFLRDDAPCRYADSTYRFELVCVSVK
ncbi:uncharacterized protein PHACADRAFT_167342 [Phanerochaete carnosa HHB-10118-sp]|uniref:Uncharacterized protein n=1 Tax=Phanerochaete carnosa (strain HHB-10118-sp) TaxID=650164 RepID=K5VD38_PHACS|nr:uncharacterized protein PHACADRAFT_167342 [Phanerochaete carnosa HHB-10118-sp]EKM49043.1 hypothetical protein PHACADRAFT_167342 [Phanerochaete carnosa HHB-10118-sp]